MDHARNDQQSWSLRSKTLLIFLLLIATPLALLGTATYWHFSSSIERRTSDYATQLVGQINQNVDRMLNEFQRLSLMPLYDSTVLSILKKYSETPTLYKQPTVEERSKMLLYIASMTFDRPDLESIQIFAKNGYTFSSKDASAIRAYTYLTEQSWYPPVQQADGAWVLIPPHKPSYFMDDDHFYFSIARIIREPNTNAMLGVVKIDIRQTMFEQILRNVKFEEEARLVIQNSEQSVFYEINTAGEQSWELMNPQAVGKETLVQRTMADGREFLMISDYSAYSGISIISYIPMSSLLRETTVLRDFTIIVGFVCLIVGGILAAYFSYHLTRPLDNLLRKMKLVEQGDFKQSVMVTRDDEIGRLSRGFNRMVEQIDRLVHEVYILGLKEKEAELAALQSQINPHFIYNTLESINMLARQRKTEEVPEMVTALGRLIRSSVDQKSRLISLYEELETAESYVRIQKLRMGPRLEVIFEVEEELLNCSVPRLILQPLIENAILHGIGGQEQGGTVWISAVRFEKDMLLTVRDDGKGMTEAELTSLRLCISEAYRMGAVEVNAPQPEVRQGNGVALINIHQRLGLIFGWDYGLDIDASPGQGTAFTLMIPLREKGDANDTADAG